MYFLCFLIITTRKKILVYVLLNYSMFLESSNETKVLFDCRKKIRELYDSGSEQRANSDDVN
jgi:hypothetical protein